MLAPSWGDMIGLSLGGLIGLGLGQQAPRQRSVLGPEDTRDYYQFQQQANALAAIACGGGRSNRASYQAEERPERDRLARLLPVQTQQTESDAGFVSAKDQGPVTTRPSTRKPDPFEAAAEQELREYLGVEDLYDPGDPWAST